VAAAILTSLTSYGEVSTIDGLMMLDTARHLAGGGMPIVERTPGEPGRDGRLYLKSAPASTVLLLPAVWIPSAAVALGAGERARTLGEEFLASQIGACARALVVALVFLLLERLSPGRRANIGLALLSLVATYDFQYGRSYYPETIVAAAILGCTIALVDVATGGRRPEGGALVIGALCAISVAFRWETAAFAPIVAFMLLRVADRPERRRSLVAFALPLLLAAIVLGLVNAARFGAPWRTGYEGESIVRAPWIGWIGLVVSPGFGLVWYAPAMLGLLFPPVWTAGGAANRTTRSTLVGLLSTAILLYGSWHAWNGGLAWGPRFLAALMPLALVVVFDSWHADAGARRAGIALVAASVVMNVLLLVAPFERFWAYARVNGWNDEQIRWSIGASPLVNQPRMTWQVASNLGDLDRFSRRAAERLGVRATSARSGPEDPAEILRSSVLLNLPALWWLKARLAGVPGWICWSIPVAGALAAAWTIRLAYRGW